MAVTVAVTRGPEIEGLAKKVTNLKVTFNSSYAGSGGEAIDLTNYADEEILSVKCSIHPTSTATGYVVTYVNDDMTDFDGGTLKAHWCDYDAVADGPLTEVLATTDLSGLIVDVEVVAK